MRGEPIRETGNLEVFAKLPQWKGEIKYETTRFT